MASQHGYRYHSLRRWIACIGLFGLAGIASLSIAATYTITDLGPNTVALDINGSGWVAGNVLDPVQGFGLTQAFVYDNAGLHLLGTVGGTESAARAINTFGVVVGGWVALDGTVHAFLHTGTAPLQPSDELPALVGFERNTADDLNDAGVAVGGAFHPNGGDTRAVKWQQGGVADLSPLAGGNNAGATAISAAGQIAGYSNSATTHPTRPHATLFDAAGIHDLGVLAGGEVSFAYDLNDRGQVVGYSEYVSGLGHAFLWENGLMTDLGIGVDSTALGINSSGQIVGRAAFSVGSSTDRAFLWQNGTTVDLNSLTGMASGWLLNSANAINDLGQIVGYGTYQGQTHGFILTQAVPEPSTMPLAIAALLSLVGVARSRLKPVCARLTL